MAHGFALALILDRLSCDGVSMLGVASDVGPGRFPHLKGGHVTKRPNNKATGPEITEQCDLPGPCNCL